VREVLALERIHKRYALGAGSAEEVHVLKGIDFRLEQGTFVAIVGASGSGKSTLLNILGCLDKPSEGTYRLDGEDVSRFDDDRLSRIRNERLGFIFQSFHLIPQLTIAENVELPLFYRGVARAERARRSEALLKQVGLGHRIGYRPSQLSGGECQRAAIARALVNDPLLLLADEPTGNLDSQTGSEILKAFLDLKAQGRTIVLITHDPGVAAKAERVVRMRDGRIVEETAPA